MGDRADINAWLHVLLSGRREKTKRSHTQGGVPFFLPALGPCLCAETPYCPNNKHPTSTSALPKTCVLAAPCITD